MRYVFLALILGLTACGGGGGGSDDNGDDRGIELENAFSGTWRAPVFLTSFDCPPAPQQTGELNLAIDQNGESVSVVNLSSGTVSQGDVLNGGASFVAIRYETIQGCSIEDLVRFDIVGNTTQVFLRVATQCPNEPLCNIIYEGEAERL